MSETRKRVKTAFDVIFDKKNGRPFWGSRFYVAAKVPFAGSVAFVVRAFMPDTDEQTVNDR